MGGAQRRRRAAASVRLDAITPDNVRLVFDLRVRPGQEAYVAPNPWSLAQALAEHRVAWPRAIVAADEVVGFLMLEIDPRQPDGRTYRLWRLMVAAERQGEGIGTAALSLAIDEVRGRGGTALYTSWRPGVGSLGPFYERVGFIRTGDVVAGEIVAALPVDLVPTGRRADSSPPSVQPGAAGPSDHSRPRHDDHEEGRSEHR